MSALYIGLTLPDELARRFPHDVQRGDPHVTVLYCAEIEASADDIMSAITSAVDGMGPVPITLSDEVIQLGEADAPVAAVTLDNDLRLRLLRLAIRAELEARGIDHPQTHPEFTPHATIRGLSSGETIDNVKAPAGSASVGVLTVRIDGVEHLVTLGPARAQLTAGVPAARVELRSMRWGQDLQAEADIRSVGVEVPAGWIIGRPFRCLAVGEIYQRVNGSRVDGGEMRGQPITPEHLASIVRVFESGEAIPVNREHLRECPEGDVIACWLVDGGQSLAVLPAYAPGMAEYVAKSSGALWSSPEIAWDTAHDAATGEVLGSMLMDGLAICSHPAQAHRKLDRVRLGADEPTNRARMAQDTEESIVDEEIKGLFEAIMKRLDEQAADIAALKGAAEQGEAEGESEGSGGSDDSPENPEQGDDEMAAELAAAKAEIERMRAEALSAEKATAVRELLTSGRITPAEKAAAEAVVERGGVELLSTVYGNRKAGSAIPKVKGHGMPVEPPAGEGGDNEWAEVKTAARELMSADDSLDYPDAVRRVIAKRQREKLTADRRG